MYRTWDRMDEGHRARVLADAEGVLARVERGGRCVRGAVRGTLRGG